MSDKRTNPYEDEELFGGNPEAVQSPLAEPAEEEGPLRRAIRKARGGDAPIQFRGFA